jgi:hypothetical protein
MTFITLTPTYNDAPFGVLSAQRDTIAAIYELDRVGGCRVFIGGYGAANEQYVKESREEVLALIAKTKIEPSKPDARPICQQYALGDILSSWPQELNYDEVISAMLNEDERISPSERFEDYSRNMLRELIEERLNDYLRFSDALMKTMVLS